MAAPGGWEARTWSKKNQLVNRAALFRRTASGSIGGSRGPNGLPDLSEEAMLPTKSKYFFHIDRFKKKTDKLVCEGEFD